MAKAITEIAIGAAAIAAPFVLPGMGIAISAALTSSLVSAGASMVVSGAMSGLSSLFNNQGGLAVGTSTPIGPHGYVYGTQKVGGVEIFRQSNNNTGGGGSTSNWKQLHRVYALACHPSVVDSGPFQLRIDGKQVLLQAAGAGWQSYSPSQLHPNIIAMSRDANGLVTLQIDVGISNLDGQEIQITESHDNTLNGIVIVTQPNPSDNTTFTFISGGTPTPAGTNPGGQFWTLYADYQDKIHVEFLNGNHTSTFPTLLAAATNWSATDLCLGRTLVYVQMGWSASVFPSSIPNVSFVIQGKNDILDPRTGSRGYTNNAALCIADFLSLPATKGGFGLTIGTDIPTEQLIAAANICDEQVPLAAGGTIPRYTCDTFVMLNQTRGAILQSLLSSCAGRISYQGGQFSIFPGIWVAPTLQLGDGDIIGVFKWKTRLSARETCNGVKGVYCSPENDYQMADFPPYMQDSFHGYDSNPGMAQYQGDGWLAEDNGERIFKDVHLPCTVHPATAQRLAKIELLRTRFQWRGTIRCSMKAYQAVALDVIELSHPRYTWVNETFEVLASRFVWDKSGNTPQIAVELDLAQTDPSVYDWNIGEEMTPQGYSQPSNVGNSVCVPPNDVTAYSGSGAVINGITYPSTFTIGADGRVQTSIYVRWDQPNDTNVVQGGHIEVQYQLDGASTWTGLTKVDPSVDDLFLTNVTDGAQYNIQVRAVNCAGVPSNWIFEGPVTAGDGYSTFTYSGYPVAPTGTLTAQGLSDGTAQITVGQFTNTIYGRLCVPSPSVLAGLQQGQLYHVYYIDPTFSGGSITPIATQNANDYLLKAGYFLIGDIITPTYTPRYKPSAYADLGQQATVNPTAAYDNDVTTGAQVGASWWTTSSGGYASANGECVWSGFPQVKLPAAATLNVAAAGADATTTAWSGAITAAWDGGSGNVTNFSTSNASQSRTVNGSAYATNMSYNAAQYEFQEVFRTKGGVNPGTVTDYVVFKGFGLNVPDGVTISGIEAQVNWAGQYAGTGTLSGMQLYYRGAGIGTAKAPNIVNAQYVSGGGATVSEGSAGDVWGAALTPAIANDATFGFGVQITAEEAGGSDRSFIYWATITVTYETASSSTLAIPAGTDLSTLTVTASSSITAGTSAGSGSGLVIVDDIYVQ